MEEKYFSLEHRENSRLVRIFQTALGIACIAIAAYWIVFSFKSLISGGTLWVSAAFLVLFGIYQILSGSGKTNKYIKMGPDGILIKQHSILPYVQLISNEIDSIEIHPLSIRFYLKTKKSIILRFGLSYTEIIIPVKHEIIAFAELNKIPYKTIEDEL
jgi:hypothetical protein